MSTGLEHLTLSELERLIASDQQNPKAAMELARRWMDNEVQIQPNASHAGRPDGLLA